MSKKLLSLALCALLVLSLAACSGDPSPAPYDAPPAPQPGDNGGSAMNAGAVTPGAGPSNTPDPVPEDPSAQPMTSDNDILVAALERMLSDLSAISTPANALPETFTATGTLTYVDDEGAPSPDVKSTITVLRLPGALALSAPELLESNEYLTLPLPDLDRLLSAATPYLQSLELTPSADGQGLTALLSGQDTAAFLKSLLSAAPAVPFLYAVISGDDRALDPASAIDSLFSGAGQAELNFNISDDILKRVKLTVPDIVTAEINVEGDDLAAEISPLGRVSLTLAEDIKLEGFLTHGDGTTVTLSWDADGNLSYINYSGDVTGLALEGKFDSSGDSLTFSGYAATGNRGDRADLELTFTPGASEPECSTPLTSLSADALDVLWARFVSWGRS